MAAVAAPRPEADPVTIAHKPLFDIFVFPIIGNGADIPQRDQHIV